jgi:FkbM family methyltransferase
VLERQAGAFRLRWILLPEWSRVLVVIVAGIVLGIGLASLLPFIMPVYQVFTGQTICPLARALTVNYDQKQLDELVSKLVPKIRVLDHDNGIHIERIYTPEREFWLERPGNGGSGKDLIGFLLAEHVWMSGNNPRNMVRQGDVVIDCGAHVGVFTHMALKAGAGTVVAVEPAPANLECLRRNFAQEIVAGRVVVIPKGVWSQETTLKLSISGVNSARDSVVWSDGGGSVDIPVTTIDAIVESLGLKRVDYVKMDIEGAEREALAGAQRTLAAHRPRLMLAMYHLPDDSQVLPALIRKAYGGDTMICGPCGFQRGKLVPEVAYFE